MTYANKVLSELEARGKVVRQHDGTYRMNNPFRANSDSHAFVLTIDDDTHGAYYDHAHDENGSLFELGDKLGIDRPAFERAHAEATHRQYIGILDYAKAHGVTVNDLHRAGWREVTHHNRPALAIPTANGTRHRFLDKKIDKNGKVSSKFINPTGYKRCWYGLKQAVKMAKEDGKALVYCNGEISTVAGLAVGVPAFTVAGGGEKAIPDELLTELNTLWKGDIIIALDCDDTGRKATEKINAQIPKAKPVDLGLTDGGDLADYCKLHTFEAIDSLTLLAVEAINTPIDAKNALDGISQLNNSIVGLHRAIKANATDLDITRILDRASTELATARQKYGGVTVQSSQDIAKQALADFEDKILHPRALLGLSCGIPAIDRMTLGFEKSKLYYFYAMTNQGKSNLMRTFILGMHENARGLIVPSESGVVDYMQSMVAMLAGVGFKTLILSPHKLPSEKKRLVRDAYEYVQDCFDFLPNGSPTSEDVRTALSADNYEYVVIDSIQNMGGVGTAYEVTRRNSKANISIAKEFNIPVIVTSQTGRNNKDRKEKEPLLQDAKHAGDIEEDGDKIFSIYNHDALMKIDNNVSMDFQYPEGTIKIKVLKDRWHDLVGAKRNLEWTVGGKLIDAPENKQGGK